ncbi:UDP-N-acetylmuramoyl-L-alanyl-D-glutamate--2,6-diaminopimelate ligase [Bacterioplanes sanyensis]|uniref:UDP-N-acetylmuramoyl-L-alanyl-D-glutamate--2,6-diaminopimelate ligase n=1 Tax=Bacterioplanes sanyensis TaxID=1249553 RepID=A0A222FDR2_9GAMM|nr:UDP-N-acetylmuramoyl-L-alanyl-D-glutamate--2,6-diaminopimelate ligase [Bacterioplanes sanyensis]ASP37225.1 UDP-N-acetylmuramoyl-L-alanyl-D-glutamate--2,6-diaminopimelate ligase [Bacterioplanes sanyensis]
MKLSNIVGPELFIPPEWDREVVNLVTDSRDVTRGDVFIARQGSQGHGDQYLDMAAQQGAVAALQEGGPVFRLHDRMPVFGVDSVSELPRWLKRLYTRAADVELIAVTGTNGKSSVSQYIAQLSHHMGAPCAVLGTLGNGVWPQLQPTRNTTADLSVTLQTLHALADRAGVAAMEVSSHGLDQGRVVGLTFDVAVMTNLTQDHLDYHGDMNSYFQAKKRLFTEFDLSAAVVCVDDDYGRQLAAGQLSAQQLLTVGRSDADVCYQVRPSDSGVSAQVSSPWGNSDIWLPLAGEFNVTNAVLAMTALAVRGASWPALVAAAAQLQPVAGRMERYRDVEGREAIIDFAHTPEALVTVLAALRGQFAKLALVFGCGGDRDRGKRPLMAQAAAQGADAVWLTNDNPRFEAPEQIFADVLLEPAAQAFLQQPDRRLAIADAVAHLLPGDCVVIAGKGHEPYQDVQGEKHPYSDAEVLRQLGFVPVAEVSDVS